MDELNHKGQNTNDDFFDVDAILKEDAPSFDSDALFKDDPKPQKAADELELDSFNPAEIENEENDPRKTDNELELDSFDVNAIVNEDDEPEKKTDKAKNPFSLAADIKDAKSEKAAAKVEEDFFDVDKVLQEDDPLNDEFFKEDDEPKRDSPVYPPRSENAQHEDQELPRRKQADLSLETKIAQMQDMVTELLLDDGTEPAKLEKFTSTFLQTQITHETEILDQEIPAQEMSTLFHTACTVMNQQEKEAFTKKIAIYSPLGTTFMNMLTYGREIDASSENVDKWVEKVDEKQSIYAVKNDRAELLKASELSAGLSELQKQLSDTDPFWMMTNSDQFRKVKTTLSEARKAVEAYETLSRQMKADKKQAPEQQEQRQKLQEEMLQKLDALAEASETYRTKKANQTSHNNRDRSREALAGKLSALAGCYVVNTRVKNAAAMSLAAKDQKDVPNLASAFVDAAIALDKYPNQPCKKEMLAMAYSNTTAKFGKSLSDFISIKLDHSAPQVRENDAKGLAAANQFKERIRTQLASYLTQSQKIAKDFEAGKKVKPELHQYLNQKPKTLNGKGI